MNKINIFGRNVSVASIAVLMMVMVASAALISMWYEGQATFSVGESLTITENGTFDFTDIVGGNVNITTLDVTNLMDVAVDAELTALITMNGEPDTEGVTVRIFMDETEITEVGGVFNVELPSGESVLNIHYEFDPLIAAGNYAADVSIIPAVA